jgi:hypothetical protein
LRKSGRGAILRTYWHTTQSILPVDHNGTLMAQADDWLWLLAGAAAIGAFYWAQSQGILPAAGTPITGTPTPLSIYPEFAYTAQTSMAATPAQQTATGQVPVQPIPQFAAVQGMEQAAVLGQCAGSYPGCTVLTGDTQLGF